MIQRSITLMRQLERETARLAGSVAALVYYDGQMPESCEAATHGERIELIHATEDTVRSLASGTEPAMPKGATYWRLFDNGGGVVMQGDGK